MRAVEKRLRERVKSLEADIKGLDADRQTFREHFARRFRWWIELQGKQEKPSLAWLIEDDAKTLVNVKWWYW